MRSSLVIPSRISLLGAILVGLVSFLLGLTFTGLSQLSLFASPHSQVIWGALLLGLVLSAPSAWRHGKTALGDRRFESPVTMPGVLQRALMALSESTNVRLLLGPAVGLLIWYLPLGLDAVAHKAVAIVSFMVVYWMTSVLDPPVTTILGCVLFWLLHVAPPQLAFSGFSTPTPWFALGGLLLGQAFAQTGLAKRLGYCVLSAAKGSLARLLLVFVVIVYLLSFFLTASGQVALLAPLAMGIVTSLGLPQSSNIGKGMFLIIGFVSGLYDKGVLASNTTIIAWGLLEKAGIRVLWSQWFLAFLPLMLLTIFASWLVLRWLYPPETLTPDLEHDSSHDMGASPGAWSKDEYKALCWTLLAVGLWATDFLHHISPAAISIAIGLLLIFPRLGVLDTKAIKAVNFWPIVFIAGTISMANVLVSTHALDGLAALFSQFEGALSTVWRATLTIYWGGFLYHFLMGSEQSMLSSLLPVLLKVAADQDYNPVAMSMLCVFSGSSKLFAYQNVGLALAYSYGFFQARDVLKFGAVLAVIQGFLIVVLASLYWPLIGIPWRTTAAAASVASALPSGIYVPGAAALRTDGVSGAHLPLTWAQIEATPGQFDWRSLEQHPMFVSAVRANKKVGLQVTLQGTPEKPAVPAWAQVPQIAGAPERGKSRLWPAVWTPQFQTAFSRFVTALGQRYDGDPRLAYVVMTEGTTIPYARHPKPWDAAGYSPAAYSSAYQHLYQTYRQAFPRTPLVAAISHFGQESQAALQNSAEGQALRELLAFTGQQGLHFLVPEVYSRQAGQRIYVRDELLRPVLRQYAERSHLLVQLDPGELRSKPLGPQLLKTVQEQWPEVPVRAVVPTR